MAFHVSCPACESRMKLPERLYEGRVRGRLATIHCTRCKSELQIDGRVTPVDRKLPSFRPSAVTTPSDASPAPASAASVEPPPPSLEPSAPPAPSPAPATEAAVESDARPRTLAPPAPRSSRPLRDPSPEELKALFALDEGWDAPTSDSPAASAVTNPAPSLAERASSEPEHPASMRRSLRLPAPPKPARQRSAFAERPPKPRRTPATTTIHPPAGESATPPDVAAAPPLPRFSLAPPDLDALAPVHEARKPETPDVTVGLFDSAPAPALDAAPPPPHEQRKRRRHTPASGTHHTDFSALLTATTVAAGARPLSARGIASRIRQGRLLAPLAAMLAIGGAGLWLGHTTEASGRARAGAVQSARLSSRDTVAALLVTSRQELALPPPSTAVPAVDPQEEAESESNPSTADEPKRGRAKAAARHAAQSTRGPFNIEQATRALNLAALRARYCGWYEPSRGQATVVVTFDPSGRVDAVRLGKALRHSAVGSCVASVMRTAHVPAYNGHRVSVARTVRLKVPEERPTSLRSASR